MPSGKNLVCCFRRTPRKKCNLRNDFVEPVGARCIVPLRPDEGFSPEKTVDVSRTEIIKVTKMEDAFPELPAA
jgi:hypothetical protein